MPWPGGSVDWSVVPCTKRFWHLIIGHVIYIGCTQVEVQHISVSHIHVSLSFPPSIPPSCPPSLKE